MRWHKKLSDPIKKLSVCQIVRLLAVFVSFVLMIRYAGRLSLWNDDIAGLHFVDKNADIKTILARLKPEFMSAPPLFYVFAYIWVRIAPYGTAWMRLPSICFTCIGMWFCGTAAKKIQGERAGVIATLLASTSWFLVRQAAYTFRFYGLLFMVSSFVLVAYSNKMQVSKKKTQILYCASIIALSFTHYFGVIVVGILGLYDLLLIVRKKIDAKNIYPYFVAGFLFLVWFLFAFSGISEFANRLENSWAAVPNLINLFGTVKMLFSNHWFVILFFVAAFVIVIFSYIRKGDSIKEFLFENTENKNILTIFCLVPIFVIGIIYIVAHLKGSVFVARYFISVIPFMFVVSAIGLDWLLKLFFGSIREDAPEFLQNMISAVVISLCFVTCFYSQVLEVKKNPGPTNQPYEQAIDWIYSHNKAHNKDTLVMLTSMSYKEGLSYYATHNGKRKDLNLGIINESNWESYETVFTAELHTSFPNEAKDILAKHYKVVENNKEKRVVVYQRDHNRDIARENMLRTARFDMKVVNPDIFDSNLALEVKNKTKGCSFSAPAWFHNDGIGYVIESYDSDIKFSISCLNDGKLRFFLRGHCVRNTNKETVPLFVKYNLLKINGENLLPEPKSFSHDNPFLYEVEVKKGDVFNVEASWSETDYASKEERDAIIKQLMDAGK